MAKITDNANSYSPGERQFLLYDYLRKNTCKGRVASVETLERLLSSNGIIVHKNTLYNDIALLSGSVYNLDIEYDKSLKGYYVKDPLFKDNELSLMVDGIQALKFITQKKADEITGKIRDFIATGPIGNLNRRAVVPNRIRSMNESVVEDVDKIYKAIETDCQIGFRYFHYSPDKSKDKTYSKKGALYIVSPYALSWNDGNYYLYAYVAEKGDFRYFRIDRMDRITNPIPERRLGKEREEKNIATNRNRAKVFNMYGGKEYTVRIRFRNGLADQVIDQFGKDTMMIPTDDKHFTVSVPIEISPTFFAWIATFGRGAKILGPKPVVEEMKKFIGKVQDMYKE